MLSGGQILNFDLCDLEKYVKSKTCIICDEAFWDVPTVKHLGSQLSRLASELQKTVFRLGPLVASRGIESDRIFVWYEMLPICTYLPSFRSIGPAVTKRAMLTDDDDDGRRRRTTDNAWWYRLTREPITQRHTTRNRLPTAGRIPCHSTEGFQCTCKSCPYLRWMLLIGTHADVIWGTLWFASCR